MWKLRITVILKAELIAVLALGITLVFTNLPFFAFFELKGLDLLFFLRGPLPAPQQIVIVDIDEASFAEIGQQWPWPRSIHAQLIRQLNKAGAKVIGFDVLFAESSDSLEDQIFADALKEAGNVVLVSGLAVSNDPLFSYTKWVYPLVAFEQATKVGIPIIYFDADGVVRRTRLLSEVMPSFALQLVNSYLIKQSPRTDLATKVNGVDRKTLSRDVLINYLGPPRTVKTVSYYQALAYEQMLPPGIFADKIVLVGRSLGAIPEPQPLPSDTFLTPFSWTVERPTAGVEIQATVVGNFLEENFVSQLSEPARLILLLSLLSAASLLLITLRPLFALLTVVLLAALMLVVAHMVFKSSNIWLPVFPSIMALGLVYGGYLLLRTLTAERERRQALEEINRSLETKVSERTRELSERHRQLEAAYQDLTRAQEQLIQSEKMASLGLLVAGVAHELNNPVSYVYSNLEFIEEYTERLAGIIEAYADMEAIDVEGRRRGDEQKKTARFDATLNTLQELIASCKEGTERVKKIVLDLRTFSRTDDIGLMSTDLHEGIESTLNLLAKQYQDRITVHRDYGNLPKVECYPGQINQVFMNLLQNAAQAIPGKGEVWIETRSKGDCVSVVIKDNGIGIAEQNLAKIFDPFFTTKPVGTGTGLGLSISYGIIEKHGGSIQVASKVNEGTEFTVELPVRWPRKMA